MDKQKIKSAIKLVEEVLFSTECPDPGFGGCIGPIPGYGCLNEAARSTRRMLEEGDIFNAIKLLKLIRSKVDGRIEITAALNILIDTQVEAEIATKPGGPELLARMHQEEKLEETLTSAVISIVEAVGARRAHELIDKVASSGAGKRFS